MQRKDYRLGYRADIEGLRALAILLVICAHAAMPGLSGGFVGVDVFFVLSGFLITGLLMQEMSNTSRLSFAEFYLRRARRLFPALIVMLLGSAALAALVLAPAAQMLQSVAGASAAAWASNIHFAFNKLDYFAPGNETNIFLHTWSLGVEEQFYLVWPALIYLVLRKNFATGLGRLRLCMMLVMVFSFGGCLFATYEYPQQAFYMMPLRAWQFAIGALVWLEFRARHGWLFVHGAGIRARSLLGWSGLLLLLGAGCLLGTDKPYPGLYALAPTIGAAFVIAAGCYGDATVVQRLLSLAPMQAIGRISYSWYLWHWPVLLLGRALTGSNIPIWRLLYVVVSLLLAVASYRLVEQPVRHQRWWLTHKRMAVYGLLSSMVLSVALMLHWYGYAGKVALGGGQRVIAESHNDAPIIYPMGCDDWYSSDRVRACAFGDAHAEHTAILFGDSIAGQWFPAVSKLFERPGWRVLVFTKSSCPMVDQDFFYSRIGRVYTECSRWRKDVLQEISKLKPDLVLISSSDNAGFSEKEWSDGSMRVLQSISSTVSHIYVLRATPHLPFDGPDCLAEYSSRPRWLPGGNGCSAPLENERADLIYASLQKAASHFENVHVLDMSDVICPGGICHAEQGRMIVFRDSQHMTATFAQSLAEKLGSRLH